MLYVTLENNLTFPVYLFSVLTNANFQLSDGDNSLIQLHFTAAFLMNNLTFDTYDGKPLCRYARWPKSLNHRSNKQTNQTLIISLFKKIRSLKLLTFMVRFSLFMCHTLAWPLKKTVQIPVLGNSIGSIGPRTRYFDLLQKHSTNSIKAGMSSYFSMTKKIRLSV